MSPRYVVLGSGRQGTAAAYDLARFGQASRIVLADARLEAAREAAERVNDLAARDVARGGHRRRRGPELARRRPARGRQVALSAVPYTFNLGITEACDRVGDEPVRPRRQHRRRLVAARAATSAARGGGRERGPRLRDGARSRQPHGRLRDGAARPGAGGLPLRRRPAPGPAGPLALPAHLPRERPHQRVRRRRHLHPGREAGAGAHLHGARDASSSRRWGRSRPSSSPAASPPRRTPTSGASSATRTRCCATRATAPPSRPTSAWACSPRSRWRSTASRWCRGSLFHRLLEPKITGAAHPRRLRAAGGGRGREGRPAGPGERGPARPVRPGDRLHRHGAPHRLARRDRDGPAGAGPRSPLAPTAWSRRCGPRR